MPLTSAEKLVEAEGAYHQLMTGVSVVEIKDSSGEAVRYTQANASRLKLYIADLKNEIAGTPGARPRPMRPVWG